jgi:hypothetical protein
MEELSSGTFAKATMNLILYAAAALWLASVTAAFAPVKSTRTPPHLLLGLPSGSVKREFPTYNGSARASEFFGHPYFYNFDVDLEKVFAPIRQHIYGDLTFEEAIYCESMGLPRLDYSARAADFFANDYFYRGNYHKERLYKPIREEKFGTKTVGEVLKELLTERAFFDCFLSVGIPRVAVHRYCQSPPANDFRLVPSCNGDEKAEEFFSHPTFYFGNDYAADLYADARKYFFGDKSVYELTQSCRSYRELEKIFTSAGIHRGIQIIQYHPAYAAFFSSSFFSSENKRERNNAELDRDKSVWIPSQLILKGPPFKGSTTIRHLIMI